jgi:hypothetical protein
MPHDRGKLICLVCGGRLGRDRGEIVVAVLRGAPSVGLTVPTRKVRAVRP